MSELEQVVKTPTRIGAWMMVVILVGMGFVVWLGVRAMIHSQSSQTDQAKRSAEWVGEKVPPKPAIQIVVHNSSRQCIRIEDVHVDNEPAGEFDFDHKGLVVFVRRICGKSGDYVEAHYRVEAADGTVIDSDYTNWQVMNSDLNQRSEWDTNYRPSARATKLVLWTSGNF